MLQGRGKYHTTENFEVPVSQTAQV